MILITGGAGFIGSNLALALQDRGVTVMDNMFVGSESNLKGFEGDIVKGDVAETSSFEGLEADVVFHMAAITDTTNYDDEEMFRVNVQGFRNVLNFAMKRGAKFVYASSAGVYGNGPVPMKEDQEMHPLNTYSKSKLECDQLARKSGYPCVGLRYFNVFGPGEEVKGKMASMIIKLARRMAAGEKPRIFRDGEQKRDHVYVKDVVEATVRAMDLEKSAILNVATGVATSFNQLIGILNKVLDTDFEPEYFENPYKGVYQNHTQADMSRTKDVLGFGPKYTVEGGMRDYFQEAGLIKG